MVGIEQRTTGKAVGVYVLCTIGVSFVVSILNLLLYGESVASGLLLLVPGVICARWWKRNAAVGTADIAGIVALSGLALFMVATLLNNILYPDLISAYADYAAQMDGGLWGIRSMVCGWLGMPLVPLIGMAACAYGMYAVVQNVKQRAAASGEC